MLKTYSLVLLVVWTSRTVILSSVLIVQTCRIREDQFLHGVETLPAFYGIYGCGMCRFGLPLQTDEKLER